MTSQYLRKISLVVSEGDAGVDLSALKIKFSVQQADADAPNTMIARIYNLTRSNADRIQKEFQRVTLQAGYEGGNFAIIFDGTIKQVLRGREDALNSFVQIMAADADEAFNFAVCNTSLAAGANLRQQADKIIESMGQFDVSASPNIPNELGTGGTLPRGKVLFGMARDRLSDCAESAAASWSIQNGKVNIIPLTGYLPGEAVLLSASTGIIGVPEATNNGIEVTTLLNPLLKIGTRVQIDNSLINQLTIREQGFPQYRSLSFPANVTDDGFYRVLVVEHEGDTRGTNWYSRLTCLAVDPSAAPASSVLAYG